MPSGIPSSGHLRPCFNRKIITIVLLYLRFCAIGLTRFERIFAHVLCTEALAPERPMAEKMPL
ncbi:MAG: hypothetical protein BWK76_13685 [Desulfobulbaceae bacterium A2]|nr:MAG: hypothetical protein BWK76_13685 [Desulfobulbaceae bacterium A2]